MSDIKRRTGRPMKHFNAARSTLGFQAPIHLRALLEAAAIENKRSLSAEMVARLEQSFDRQHLLALVQMAIHGRAPQVEREDGA